MSTLPPSPDPTADTDTDTDTDTDNDADADVDADADADAAAGANADADANADASTDAAVAAAGIAMSADDVVVFWRRGRHYWFRKNADFDRRFHERCFDLHLAAARRELDSWNQTPTGALALLILLDQFPRNAFRGTAHMYATDPLARHYARAALALGHPEHVDPRLKLFFYLPFEHSEDLADQDLSVTLHASLDTETQGYAERHRDIIRRFGRFPHRNPMLLRETTAEEQAYLDSGGFAG